ncbi:MAG: hypothetical protein QOF76_3560 [Solirubrobacteraceae bacterium]|jgi:DNA-binding beta-propeller fold protein YncE|nr:hypothetical protein [Solirubrobacteraceae bacterium]
MYRKLLVLVLLSATVAAIGVGTAQSAKPRSARVMVVSNNWDGTADIVDARTLKRLKRLNVVPDKDERIAEINANPARLAFFTLIREQIGEGHDQYVDDGFVSRDGTQVFFSRPSFADVVAIDIKTNAIAWRHKVEGYRSDHMALSPDGTRLLVSASTARKVEVIDTATGAQVNEFPSGDTPHESNYTHDGKHIYQASIGTVYSPTDDPAVDASKGERLFEIVDAETYKVERTFDIGAIMKAHGINVSGAVRPMAVAPDDRHVYFQLSFMHGFVEFDLKTGEPIRMSILPLTEASAKLDRSEYLLDSAHHGLGMNPSGTKLCVAGTMSGYAAIVDTKTLTRRKIIPIGEGPYWSTSDGSGTNCWVSVAREDKVAIIDWKTGKLRQFIGAGDHPQRIRPGRVLLSAVR